MNDSNITAIEYFPTESYNRPKYSLNVAFPDKKERSYRIVYDEVATSLQQRDGDKEAEMYFVDAYDGSGQSIVTVFNRPPSYEQMRSVVIKDMTEGRKSFYACIDETTKKPMPCKK